MKKIIITLAVILNAAFAVSAQTIVVEEKPVLTNKRGVPVLPQAGDFAIGISTAPFLNYFGNMFTDKGTNTAPTFMNNGAGISLKYFQTDRRAMRAGVNLNFGKTYSLGYPTNNNNSLATVTDQMTVKDFSLGLNFGYEWRRGIGRLQGFWGCQASLSFSTRNIDYSYGNAMASGGSWVWDFNTNTQNRVSERPLCVSGIPNITIGVSGFVGVEYFFAPKMSIGGELGMGLFYNYNKESDAEMELQGYTKIRDPRYPASGVGFDTGTNGNIFLSFYF